MRQPITDIIETGANREANKFNPARAFVFLNKRSEGFCECCFKDFSPGELIRKTQNAGVYSGMDYTYVFYLCRDCDE